MSKPGKGGAEDWSRDFLRRLDWKKREELVSHLMRRAGHRTEVVWVRPDGASCVEVTCARHGPMPHSVLHNAPWLSAEVDGPAVGQLLAATQAAGAARGIYATPGEFTGCARLFAANLPLELVDGGGLLGLVRDLPEEERKYLWNLLTIGRPTAPTCPSCGRTMEEFDELAPPPGAEKRDMVLRRHHTVEEHFAARDLTVEKRGKVRFLGDAVCRSVTVRGRAEGNFHVEGRLTMARGARVTGVVTAREVFVETGGELEARVRTFPPDVTLPRAREPARRMVWRCAAWRRCRARLPHSGLLEAEAYSAA